MHVKDSGSRIMTDIPFSDAVDASGTKVDSSAQALSYRTASTLRAAEGAAPSVRIDLTLDAVSIDSEYEIRDRETWTGNLDFVFSCIGYAVGLGNIWRFPNLCYSNGGGAFLVPYLLFALVVAMPLFLMEISFGQFASLSPITIWRISPLFKGLGYGMVMVCFQVCSYYNVILAWNFYYMFNSFNEVLPWTQCGQSWNSDCCRIDLRSATDTASNSSGEISGTIGSSGETNSTFLKLLLAKDDSVKFNASGKCAKAVTAAEEYYNRNMLERHLVDGIGPLGNMRWPLFGYLALAWFIVFLCLFKGIHATGKIVYVTAMFPYVILTALLFRGVTLDGAGDGIYYYMYPSFEKLQELPVWSAAASQIFYSQGAAWGVLITMSSYNKFTNNVISDACVVPVVNCCTSIFAGFAVFSILGFMAKQNDVNVKDVVKAGAGLAFMAYPEAAGRLPFGNFWAVAFFLMIFTLGLDSQFSMFETMTAAFIDEYPRYRTKKALITMILILFEFGVGAFFVTQGGVYLLHLVDTYSGTFSVMVISMMECFVIAWIYGVERFCMDIELMIGRRPPVIFNWMWKYVTPSITLIIYVMGLYLMKTVTYDDLEYPLWGVLLGFGFGLMTVVPIPVMMVVTILQEEGPFLQRVKKLTVPTISYGPILPENYRKYVATLTEKELRRSSRQYSRKSSAMTDQERRCRSIRRNSVGSLGTASKRGSIQSKT